MLSSDSVSPDKGGVALMTEVWQWLIMNGHGAGDMAIISVSTNERGVAFNSVGLVKEVWPM